MMARAQPKLALRPMLPADAPQLADIFRESIAELTADDYSESQQEAWAAAADDKEAFAARLARELTVVATLAGAPVGFVSLQDGNRIDMLYVHPAASGEGVGTMLCEAIERLAASRGARRLSVDASDNARGFFARRGYVAQRRNTIPCGGEWLGSTTMRKELPAERRTDA